MGNFIIPSSSSPNHGQEKCSTTNYRMMENFLNKVGQRMRREEFFSKFSTTTDYTDQIRLIKSFMDDDDDWLDCFYSRCGDEEFLKVCQKNDKLSSKYCEGMEEFCEKIYDADQEEEEEDEDEDCEENLKEADKQCNLAIAYAHTREFLAEAFAKRSVLLNRMRETEGALQAIDMALNTASFSMDDHDDDEDGTRSRWQELRADYAAELERELTLDEKERRAIWTVERNKRKLFCKNLFHIKSPNPMAPAVEDFVEIAYNSERGRHLIVNKDVPIGQTILVERPFVSGLNGTLEMEHSHCHFCLKKNLNYIPCPNCVFALFCDENCLEAATVFHKFECPCLPHLCSVLSKKSQSRSSNSFDGVNFHMAFKLICTLGPEQLFQLFVEDLDSRKDVSCPTIKNSQKNETILGVDPVTGIYDPSSYHPVGHLATEFTPTNGHFHLPLISLILVRILEAKTTFFENIHPSQKTQFGDFVAQKILHHYSSIRVNVFSIWELNGRIEGLSPEEEEEEVNNKDSKMEYEVNLFARGLFSTASLLNHSCDPNVMLFPGGHSIKAPGPTHGQIAIVSVKPLKKGEELTIFYCPPFSDQARQERQNRLWTGYSFHCTCLPCVDQWPTMTEGLSTAPKRFCCRKCSSTQLFHEMKSKKRMEDFVLTKDNGFRCPTCRTGYNERNILNEFSRHKRALTISLRQVQTHSPLQALKSLRAAMEFFDTNIIPPYAFSMFIQKFYIEAIQCIIHFSK